MSEDSFDNDEAVKEILSALKYGPDRTKSVMYRAYDEFRKGLNKDLNDAACVKMLPTYVVDFPDGTESGTFLALDLGGTNFRVLLITISANGSMGPRAQIDSRIYRVPKAKMEGTADELFDHIAWCIHDFTIKMDIEQPSGDDKIPIGFTFSFPCRQKSLAESQLINWTKGFCADGAEGQSVGGMLDEALVRRGDVNYLEVSAICNDTVGTLMSCAFDNPDCKIGLICGTGSNACYVEYTKNIEMISEELRQKHDKMVINTEWGNMGGDGIFADLRTEFDREVDDNSPNKGRQIFEKLMAGMYLGELVRLIMRRLHAKGILFNGEKVEKLYEQHSIDTSFLSNIEDVQSLDDIVTLQNVIATSLDIGAVRADCDIIYRICKAVSNRAATLCAAPCAAMCLFVNGLGKDGVSPVPQKVTIGVDGSVFRKHPTFGKKLTAVTNQLLQTSNVQAEYVLSHDGSGKGAALTVAAATRAK